MKKKNQENQCIANAGTENYMAPPTIVTVGITNDMKAGLSNEGHELDRPMEYEAANKKIKEK